MKEKMHEACLMRFELKHIENLRPLDYIRAGRTKKSRLHGLPSTICFHFNDLSYCYSKRLLNFLKNFSFVDVVGLKFSESSTFSNIVFSSLLKTSGT